LDFKSGLADGDFCIEFKPDPAYNGLLFNRYNDVNGTLFIELEIEVENEYSNKFTVAALEFLDQPVTAIGVYINDDGHDSKTELHPLDCLYGDLPQSQWPAWTIEKRSNLPSDYGFKVIRFLSAGDDSWGLHPPKSMEQRTINVHIAMPTPDTGKTHLYDWTSRIGTEDSAYLDTFDIVKNPKADGCFEFNVTPYRTGFGPSTIMVDFAVWWKIIP
ncbi:MAG TPA: hypothetical protein VFI33_09380, partial [Puia sp.]|nr:hypothetical protein [Puia sp.]